jgi:hypothetical protein
LFQNFLRFLLFLPQFQALEFGEGFDHIVFRLPPQDHRRPRPLRLRSGQAQVRFAEIEQGFTEGVVFADIKGGVDVPGIYR